MKHPKFFVAFLLSVLLFFVFLAKGAIATCNTTFTYPACYKSCASRNSVVDNFCYTYAGPPCTDNDPGCTTPGFTSLGTNTITECTGNAEAKAFCGSDCQPKGTGCTSNAQCCAGLTCNNGICASTCIGNENNAAVCAADGGNWTSRTPKSCFATGLSDWCGYAGCEQIGLESNCNSNPSCEWHNPQLAGASCSFCACPPPCDPNTMAQCTDWKTCDNSCKQYKDCTDQCGGFHANYYSQTCTGGSCPMPNLAISQLVITGGAPNSSRTATMLVSNTSGLAINTQFVVGLNINNGAVSCAGGGATYTQTIASLAANSSLSVPIGVTLPSTLGTYNATAMVDYGCAINESEEVKDNWAYTSYQVNQTYFTSFGGDVVAHGVGSTVSDPNLPASKYISGNNTNRTDAGIVIAGGSLPASSYGLGAFSQNGTAAPGWNLPNYSPDNYNLSGLSYNVILNSVSANAQAGAFINSTQICGKSLGGFYFTCYGTGSYPPLDTAIDNAITAPSGIYQVIVPTPGAGLSSQTISLTHTVSGTNRILVFVPGNLNVNGSITSTLNTSGIAFVLKDAGPSNNGSLIVLPGVLQLDGLYIFPGQMTDGGGAANLTVNGSLIGTGLANPPQSSFNLTRSPLSGSALTVNFQGKYLSLFKSLLGRPKHTWSEVTPAETAVERAGKSK